MPPKKAKKNPLIPTNKPVPVLPEHTDFYDIFGVNNDDTDRNFSDLIEETLATGEIAAALKEKVSTDKKQGGGKQTNKQPPPQSVLDLHGFTAREAEDKTASFVRAASKNGLQSLLIITGKGLHSEGDSILRDVVETTVIGLKKQNVIVSFKWEKKLKYKSGAMIVYLN
jgi:DNA-nicking Smr family endonuclease